MPVAWSSVGEFLGGEMGVVGRGLMVLQVLGMKGLLGDEIMVLL